MSTKFQIALQSACNLVEGGTSEAEAISIVVANHSLNAAQAQAMQHRVEAEMDARRAKRANDSAGAEAARSDPNAANRFSLSI